MRDLVRSANAQALVALAVVAGAALLAIVWPAGMPDEPALAPVAPMLATTAVLPEANLARAEGVVATPATGEPPAACPLQSMLLATSPVDPQSICVSETVVEQTGNVRSHRVSAGGVPGWTLRVDTVDGELHAVSLLSRDGHRFACEEGDCGGSAQLDAHPAGGLRSIRLTGMRLAAARNGEAAMLLSTRLRVPSADSSMALACNGPGLNIAAPDGTLRRFCGQAGAAIEFGEGGQRIHRIHDHEGRTLVVELDEQQRVLGVAFGAYSCRGAQCSGASTSAATPQKDLGEHSFYFGRTPLRDARSGAAAPPGLVLDGSLSVAAQE